MKNSTEKNSINSANNQMISKSYKVLKKIVKYCAYAALLYFAYQGFMAWK
jgi:hypothetical protein